MEAAADNPGAADEPRLPRIIWVASRPPVPPFSGETGKTLCGITALASATQVDVVTFANPENATALAEAFSEYWRNRPVSAHWLQAGRRPGLLKATLARRFLSGLQIENSGLSTKLEELNWDAPTRMVIFDDIVLAPLLARYGRNAIISPHDCISAMFWSHFRGAPFTVRTGRNLLSSMIARYHERSFFQRALLTHVVTQRDCFLLEKINPRARYAMAINADLLNPGFTVEEVHDWDVLVWGDLAIGSIARGAREFLAAARSGPLLSDFRVLVVGRVDAREARKILGAGLLSRVEYSPRLEDASGRIRQAKVTVIPDIGGAGMKNRCVNILSAGRCLACLYPQMAGMENACGSGAINARTPGGLSAAVAKALSDESWRETARKGREIFRRDYGEEQSREQWLAMVKHAVAIRAGRR